jgi:hypothetical protein
MKNTWAQFRECAHAVLYRMCMMCMCAGAQAICVGLQKAGLTASVAPDADFENAMKNRRED